MQTAEALKAQLQQAQVELAAARDALWAAQRNAQTEFDKVELPHRVHEHALKTAHSARAFALAIEDQNCPYTRSGRMMEPTDREVEVGGVCLVWDINGDYAPMRRLIPWERLLAPVPVVGHDEETEETL